MISNLYLFLKLSLEEAEFPHKHVYLTYLQSHCNHGDYEDALAMFDSMDGSKINLDINVYNILIDGASKCGKIDTTRRLFHDLFVKGLQPDVETYTLMIRGLCQRGRLKDAERLLVMIKKTDCCPNNVIINDFVQGYLKNGLFNDAGMIVKEMWGRRYKISASNMA